MKGKNARQLDLLKTLPKQQLVKQVVSRELGSARQVCQWYRQEGVELPVVPLH